MKTAIVLVTDSKGYDFTRLAATAASLTQTEIHDYWIVCNEFDPPDDQALKKHAKKINKNINLKKLETTDNYNYVSSSTHVPKTTLLKIHAIESIIQDYDRVLYIDGDVLLMQDFGLQKVDFEGECIAAVYDFAETTGLVDPSFFEQCEVNGISHHYFNAGVIAIDCKAWETANPKSRYNQIVERHSNGCKYKTNCASVDQCAWNELFEGHWKRLPIEMNMQACAMFTGRWQRAIARHYVGKQKYLPFKPWRNDQLDSDLIKMTRSALGLTSEDINPNLEIRTLNRIRNAFYSKKINGSIKKIEAMQNESMLKNNLKINQEEN